MYVVRIIDFLIQVKLYLQKKHTLSRIQSIFITIQIEQLLVRSRFLH